MHVESHLLNEAAMAACWTLVHSLWQGLLLIILTGLVMVSTRKCRPVLRYRLLSALIVLFVIGAVTTFAREWDAQSSQEVVRQAPAGGVDNGVEPAVGAGVGVVPVAGVVDGVAPAVGGGSSIAAVIGSCAAMVERVNTFLSAHAAPIVMVWLVILGVRLGRMGWALAYTRHIRQREGRPLPEYWTGRLKELSERLGLRRSVGLLESAVMKVPVAFGHLKPVIFIPLGLFAKLPPEQAEAILLHELAHIKRDDYLVNLLQRMAEHLFFFNPGVLWLSALIREARENCCDDMAIAETGDKKQLVRALIGFRELSSYAGPVYGMGFAGRRNVFVNRIARIVHNRSKGLTVGEGVFFGFSVLLIGLLAMAFKQGGRQSPGGIHKVPTVVVASQDTLPPAKRDTIREDDGSARDRLLTLDVDLPHGKQVIVVWHNDQLFHITQVNGVVTELSIGDISIPADKIETYEPTIRRIFEDIDRVRIDRTESAGYNDTLARPQLDLRMQEEAIENAQMKLLTQMKDLQAAQVDVERQNIDRRALENALKDREVDIQKENKDLSDRENDLERAQKAGMQMNGIVAVMQEAVKRGIVSDVSEIRSMHLTKDSLSINGKKQSAAIQRAFSKKFVLTPELEFHFESSDK
jgi:bla regulator protein BlaR1